MIVRALERGVSEEKIGRALNVDARSIRRRRNLLEGICPEVVELLKDRSVTRPTLRPGGRWNRCSNTTTLRELRFSIDRDFCVSIFSGRKGSERGV